MVVFVEAAVEGDTVTLEQQVLQCVHPCDACKHDGGNVEMILTHWPPGRHGCHFKTAIFNLVLLIGIFTLSNNNAPRWMPWDLTDGKSTLVQVMAWGRQATQTCWQSTSNERWSHAESKLAYANYPNTTCFKESQWFPGPICHDITYGIAITVAESESDFRTTTDTP